jgi:hypothetical protein
MHFEGDGPSLRWHDFRFEFRNSAGPRHMGVFAMANPSPPPIWVEIHLQATEHAQHTTKPLRGKAQNQAAKSAANVVEGIIAPALKSGTMASADIG